MCSSDLEGYQTQYQTYNPQPFSKPAAGTQSPVSTASPGTIDFSGLPTVVQPQQSSGGGLKGLVQGASSILSAAEKPFLGIGALPLQGAVAGYNALTGSHVQDPFANGVPAGLPGAPTQTGVTPLNVKQKAGDALQVGSYFVPGGEGLPGIIAGGAAMGAAQGGGSALSANKNLENTVVDAGEGAILNAGLAGGAGLVGKTLSKVGDAISGEGLTKAYDGLKNAYSQALNLNAAERGFEQRSGKDLSKVLMEHGAPLGRYENGTLDASNAIEQLQSKLEPLNATAKEILTNPQGVVKDIHLPDVLASVQKEIQGMKLPQLEKNKAMKTAQDMITAEMQQHGMSVNPALADEIKQGFQTSIFKKALTSSDQLRGNTAYTISTKLKTAVEDAVKGTDTHVDLSKLNAQRSDLIDAIKRLSKLDGVRVVRGGKLGNMAGGVVGAIAGAASGLGPIGALGGDYFGTKAAEFLNNPATKIGVAAAKTKAAGVIPGLVGEVGKGVGKGVNLVGKGVVKSARGVGLLGNILTNAK